jgi:hypothetical protein
VVESVRLEPEVPMTEERKGEFYFHDAGICYQGWRSCANPNDLDGATSSLSSHDIDALCEYLLSL